MYNNMILFIIDDQFLTLRLTQMLTNNSKETDYSRVRVFLLPLNINSFLYFYMTLNIKLMVGTRK